MRTFLIWIILVPSLFLLGGCTNRAKENDRAARWQEEPRGPMGDFLKEWLQVDLEGVDRDKFPKFGEALIKADSLFFQAREMEVIISAPLRQGNKVEVYNELSMQLVQLGRLVGELNLLLPQMLQDEMLQNPDMARVCKEEVSLLSRGMKLVVDVIPAGQKWIKKDMQISRMRRENKELIAALDSFHTLVEARKPVDTSVLNRAKMPRCYDYFVKSNTLFRQMKQMDSCLNAPLKRAEAEELYALVKKNYDEAKAVVSEMNELVSPVNEELKSDPGIASLLSSEFGTINEGTKLFLKVSLRAGTFMKMNLVD